MAIPDLERLRWGVGRENTFIAALAAAARAMGDDAGYDFLMGASGAAFRIHFHQPEWCPSSPDATCGFDCSVPAVRALGRSCSWHHGREADDETRARIVRSLAEGRPVLGIALIGPPDWGVIVGERDDGRVLLCQTFWNAGEEPAEATAWPWALVFLGDRTQRPARSETVEASLRLAVELAETERYDKYASGWAAYRAWIDGLRDDARFGSFDDEQRARHHHITAWCHASLLDARSAAVGYLRDLAGEFGTGPAADLYAETARILEQGRRWAPYPRQLEPGEAWTPELRRNQADSLEQALTQERQALAALRQSQAEPWRA